MNKAAETETSINARQKKKELEEFRIRKAIKTRQKKELEDFNLTFGITAFYSIFIPVCILLSLAVLFYDTESDLKSYVLSWNILIHMWVVELVYTEINYAIIGVGYAVLLLAYTIWGIRILTPISAKNWEHPEDPRGPFPPVLAFIITFAASLVGFITAVVILVCELHSRLKTRLLAKHAKERHIDARIRRTGSANPPCRESCSCDQSETLSELAPQMPTDTN
jgi:hypothetical protein